MDVGLTWKDIAQPDDRIGVAFTQPLKATSIAGGGDTNEVDPLLWEVYYSWKVNDSMTITPAIFGGNSKNLILSKKMMILLEQL